MGDVGDFWRDIKSIGDKRKVQRYKVADCEFKESVEYAKEYGCQLLKCSPYHYQFICKKLNWLLNFYPGNQRLYADKNSDTPYFKMEKEINLWNVCEVFVMSARLKLISLENK